MIVRVRPFPIPPLPLRAPFRFISQDANADHSLSLQSLEVKSSAIHNPGRWYPLSLRILGILSQRRLLHPSTSPNSQFIHNIRFTQDGNSVSYPPRTTSKRSVWPLWKREHTIADLWHVFNLRRGYTFVVVEGIIIC